MKVRRIQQWQCLDNWEWFGHAGHFILGHKCRFHLTTKIGPWLVSTVGEYVEETTGLYPTEQMVEICTGFKYETEVFAAGERCTAASCECGLPDTVSLPLESVGYNTAGDATKGHMAMCWKYSQQMADESEGW